MQDKFTTNAVLKTAYEKACSQKIPSLLKLITDNHRAIQMADLVREAVPEDRCPLHFITDGPDYFGQGCKKLLEAVELPPYPEELLSFTECALAMKSATSYMNLPGNGRHSDYCRTLSKLAEQCLTCDGDANHQLNGEDVNTILTKLPPILKDPLQDQIKLIRAFLLKQKNLGRVELVQSSVKSL